MVRTVFAALLVALSAAAQAQTSDSRMTVPALLRSEMGVTDESIAQCKQANGAAIDPEKCARWRRTLATADAEKRRLEAQIAEAKAQSEADDEQQRRKEVLEERRRAQRAAERASEAAAERVRRAVEDEAYRVEREKADKADAALQKACGADYQMPRVGMTLARAQQCVGGFEPRGQVNRRDGVVTTYDDGATYLHVMGGRVVAWGRY